MLNNIYILGAGRMAREVYQIYVILGKKSFVKGFLINSGSDMEKIDSKPVINYPNIKKISKKASLVNGMGSILRKTWILELEDKSFTFDSIIHPTVVMGEGVSCGKDLVIFPNSTVLSNVVLGNHVFISANTYIGHDSIIGNFVTVAPGVNIGGYSKIGNGTFIGIGSSIIQGIKIGSNVVIGAGSVVVEDIPDGVVAYGNPAKPAKKVTEEFLKKLL